MLKITNPRSQVILSPFLREPLCPLRSEEHTSELQSRLHLVCRLLLEKKKKYHTAFAIKPGPPAPCYISVPALLNNSTDGLFTLSRITHAQSIYGVLGASVEQTEQRP